MTLQLGRSLDRNYNIRIPFLNGHYHVGVFFNKRSNFLLFKADPDFAYSGEAKSGIKINMFKNLQSSKFCETFLKLNDYKGDTLDIVNQFDAIKDDYYTDIIFAFNESVVLSKHETEKGKPLFSNVLLYGMTISSLESEFIFIIAERQHINTKLRKKIVRTTAIQISTSNSMKILDDFYEEYKESKTQHIRPPILDNTKTIKMSDVDKG